MSSSRFILSFAAALLAPLAASAQNAAPAGALHQQLFGATSQTMSSVCFKRVYDARHLATHPQQNVTTMLMLLTVDKQQDARDSYIARMGVTFRGKAPRFEVNGYCSAADGALNCGVECDGGQIDVAIRDANSVRVTIPHGARVSRADSGAEVTGRTFGQDDKVFRLDRTKVTDCLPVAHDPKLRASLRGGR